MRSMVAAIFSRGNCPIARHWICPCFQISFRDSVTTTRLHYTCVIATGQQRKLSACQIMHSSAPRLKWHAARGLSSTVGKIIEYGELKELLKNEGVTHIDVREPWEVKEFGVINGTINIPIGDLMAALQMTPKDFEEKYHQELPDKSDTVVFSCLAGIRSQKALDVASSLGYSRILNYGGGIEDWARHEAPIKS